MATSTIPSNFVERSKEFLSALVTWERDLPSIAWSDLHSEAQQGRVALSVLLWLMAFVTKEYCPARV